MNHSNDDWYIDSGMHGVRVVVQNDGLQLSRYAPDWEQSTAPRMVLRVFLLDLDREWKRACEEASK